MENVLELEVVTPTGNIVTADSNSYPDLFWALRGGGASTFGVVTKITYKAYPRPTIVPCTLMFSPPLINGSLDYDAYYKATAYFLSIAPAFNDFGMGGYPAATKLGYVGPYVATNKSQAQVSAFLDSIAKPMANNWNVTFNYQILPESVMDDIMWPTNAPTTTQEPAGRYWVPMVSRLLSRSAMTNKTADIYRFVKTAFDDGATIMPHPSIPGASKRNRPWDFALNPAWKDTAQHIIVANWNWNSMQDVRNLYDRMMNKYIPLLRVISENDAAYINEATPFERNWKTTFYGGGQNYERLLSIKKKYDPDNVLWCSTCVGNDVFMEGSDGRLYKT